MIRIGVVSVRPIAQTKLKDLTCPELKQFTREVAGCVQHSVDFYGDYSIHDFLSVIFPKYRVKISEVEPWPGCLLLTRMEKLAESPIYDLARELAQIRTRIQLGSFDGKKLLTFLRQCYPLERSL